jgi:hypothetical protein
MLASLRAETHGRFADEDGIGEMDSKPVKRISFFGRFDR